MSRFKTHTVPGPDILDSPGDVGTQGGCIAADKMLDL